MVLVLVMPRTLPPASTYPTTALRHEIDEMSFPPTSTFRTSALCREIDVHGFLCPGSHPAFAQDMPCVISCYSPPPIGQVPLLWQGEVPHVPPSAPSTSASSSASEQMPCSTPTLPARSTESQQHTISVCTCNNACTSILRKGSCKHGNTCLYCHDHPKSSGAKKRDKQQARYKRQLEHLQEQLRERGLTPSSGIDLSDIRGDNIGHDCKGGKPCLDLARKGKCRAGDSCIFCHEHGVRGAASRRSAHLKNRVAECQEQLRRHDGAI
eukprot:TRINITY_DN13894_c0_g1_i3.p1 TRINITY_DN13894_c0_g1~~TRINITY_DN13894_c0_g1_i3.p1  ORF type:complete len:288 (+),score=41.54 TRINITY_DN13894_c0_g1_i3:65-865(+)